MISLRLTAAALRNYASPVLWRENQFVLMAVLYGAYQPFMVWDDKHFVARHGIHAVFAPHGPPMVLWWLLAWALPTALTFHFWRQVRTEQAMAIPNFIAAETMAIYTLILPVLALLMTPFLLIGAPVMGTLALTLLGMMLGGAAGQTGKTGQGAKTKRLRMWLTLPLMAIGFFPNAVGYIMFAPWPVDTGVIMAAGFLLITGLQFRPAMAALQETQADHAWDSATTRPNPIGARLVAVLTWRPNFLPALALPGGFGVPFGPVGVFVAQLLPMALFLGVMPLILALVKHHPYHQFAHEIAPTILPLLLSIGLSGAGQWLMLRADWPPLFCAGRYGSRKGFAEALFNAHRLNLLQTALISTALAMLTAWALNVLPGAEILPAALIACGLIFGGGYSCALPLLWRELGGKGMIMACTMAGYMAAYFTLLFTVFLSQTLWLAAWIAAAMMIFGLTMGRLAPSRLAAIDWPLETD